MAFIDPLGPALGRNLRRRSRLRLRLLQSSRRFSFVLLGGRSNPAAAAQLGPPAADALKSVRISEHHNLAGVLIPFPKLAGD